MPHWCSSIWLCCSSFFLPAFRAADRLAANGISDILMHPCAGFCLYFDACVPCFLAYPYVTLRMSDFERRLLRVRTIKQDAGVWRGRPAKQSADKSQDEFLMQSPWRCWILQRRHWVVAFFPVLLVLSLEDYFDIFFKVSFSFTFLSFCAQEVWHPPKQYFWNVFCGVFIGDDCFSGY